MELNPRAIAILPLPDFDVLARAEDEEVCVEEPRGGCGALVESVAGDGFAATAEVVLTPPGLCADTD